MATVDYSASIGGVAMRLTRLDGSGNLLTGPMDSYTTNAFIRVSFTPEYEEGDEITEKAADGTVCISFKAPDTLKRVNLEIAVCDPDPEVTAMLSGGMLLEHGGKSVGWASGQVGEDPSGNGIAVEVWSRAIANGKPAGDKPYFHWVFPYVKTRLSGDRVIENGLLANTYEGFGVGNMNFRSAIDGTWLWPAAADRPYMYARTWHDMSGKRGFYTWTPGAAPSPTGAQPAKEDKPVGVPSVSDLTSETGPTGVGTGPNPRAINIKGTVGAPYPYTDKHNEDYILSVQDTAFEAKAGAVDYPAMATQQDVKNVSPTDQPDVTYLKRGDTEANRAFASPGNTFTETGVVARDALNAAKLQGLGYVASPTSAWASGEFMTVSGYEFHWNGTAWEEGTAP